MIWTVVLENEDGNAISSLSEPLSIRVDLMERLSELKLLRYLDPYGDATFNHLQMDDLIKDLDDLENIEHNPLTAEIQKLAARCKSEVHTYLTFYGD